jgi:hypothetical protein
MKIVTVAVTVAVATLGMVAAASAADLPHRQPVPVYPQAPIGKMPIGKSPIGKFPYGKTPVAARY